MAVSAVLVRIASLITNFVVAGILGPADFGVLKIISFVPSIAKYGGIGLAALMMREVPHIRSRGADEATVRNVKSVVFTTDLVWSLVLASGIAASAMWFDRTDVRVSLMISAAALVIRQLLQIYDGVATIDRRLSVVAASGVFAAIIQSAVTLALVWSMGIVGVLIGSLAGATGGVLWLAKNLDLDFGFRFDIGEILRLGRMAIPLSGMTLATGLFAWAERIEVLSLYGSGSLGIYILGVTAFQAAAELIFRLQKTLSVPLYELLAAEGEGGRPDGLLPAGRMIATITIALGVVMPFLGGGLWLVGPYLVNRWLPEFGDVVPMLPWIAAMIGVIAISSTAHHAMTSSRIGMRIQASGVTFFGAGVFVALTFMFKELGGGVEYAAISKAIAFAVIAVLVFALVGGQIFTSRLRSIVLLGKALLPLAIMFGVVVLLNQTITGTGFSFVAARVSVFTFLYVPLAWLLLAAYGYVDLRDVRSLRSFGSRP